MRVAVFGDVHGHLRLMFQLCRLWQLKHRMHLDAVLVCGDLGFFPQIDTADKATRRFARNDPEELGFARYFARPLPPDRDTRLEQTLEGPLHLLETVRCPVLWCEGNHEDFFALEKEQGSAQAAPVDVFDRLWHLRSGRVFRLEVLEPLEPIPGYERITRLVEESGRVACVYPCGAENVVTPDPTFEDGVEGMANRTVLRIGALGGGPEQGDTDTYAGSVDFPGRVGFRAFQHLQDHGFDVLLTHAGTKGLPGGPAFGSLRITKLIERVRPSLHVYAHHKRRYPPLRHGETLSVWLNDVSFERSRSGHYQSLESGCMGLLSWHSRTEHKLEVVEDRWMEAVTWQTWQSL